jgi:uncharacterized protein involved in exopolysaccharide biosynthesis
MTKEATTIATLTAAVVIIVVVIAAALTTTYAQEPTTRKAVFDANDTITVDRQNEAVLTSSDIQSREYHRSNRVCKGIATGLGK